MNHPTIRNLILLGLSSLLSVCALQAEYSISYQNQRVANGICYVDVVVSISGNGAPLTSTWIRMARRFFFMKMWKTIKKANVTI